MSNNPSSPTTAATRCAQCNGPLDTDDVCTRCGTDHQTALPSSFDLVPDIEHDRGAVVLTFPACRDEWASMSAAVRYLEKRGFSVGRQQAHSPRGILLGDFDIQKWRNLSDADRDALHGEMTGDGRHGPIEVRIHPRAPVEAKLAIESAFVAARGPMRGVRGGFVGTVRGHETGGAA